MINGDKANGKQFMYIFDGYTHESMESILKNAEEFKKEEFAKFL